VRLNRRQLVLRNLGQNYLRFEIVSVAEVSAFFRFDFMQLDSAMTFLRGEGNHKIYYEG
jgi:hypothetical protein